MASEMIGNVSGWMRRRPVVVGLAALALVAVLGFVFLGGAAEGQTGGREVVVRIDANGFDPKSLEIGQGDTVVFDNVGDEPHWPASNIHPTHRLYPDTDNADCGTEQEGSGFDACRPVMPGESYTFTFNYPGLWRFHDHLNPQLSGKINVVALEGQDVAEIQLGPTEEPERAYDENIPEDAPVIWTDEVALYSYVRKYGAAKTIQYLHALQSQLGDCHQNAHSAGRFAYELFSEAAFQTCSAECHSGCYHGATEAYFRDHGTANLAQDLAVICSSELNQFLSHQCFHGVGHGLMAFADYELFEALANCDLLPQGQESCYSGVYMENVVGGLSPTVGHFTDYLNENPHFPCNIVDEKYKNACYFYQTSRMVQLFDWDFARVAQACGEADEQYQRSCFESMGRDVGGVNFDNNARAIEHCGTAPEGQPRIWCLSGAVQNTFWDPAGQDQALDFCARLDDQAEKAGCYETIFQRAPLILEQEAELQAFCGKAEPDYRQPCLEAVAKS